MLGPRLGGGRLRHLPLTAILAALAGCLADAPAAEDAAEAIEASPVPSGGKTAAAEGASESSTLVATFSGTILLRPASSRDTLYTGDRPAMHFTMPPNATRLEATLAFSPPQDMGLELVHHETEQRIRSWDDPVMPAVESPIVVVLEDEIVPGEWVLLLGPRAVGGLVDWTLDLVFTIDGPAPEALDYEN